MKTITSNIFIILTKEEKKKIPILILFSICISILDVTFLAFALFVINFYTQHTGYSSTKKYLKWIYDKDSVGLISLFLCLFTLKNTAAYLATKAQFKFAFNVANRISTSNLKSYFEDSYYNYINVDSSVHIRKISQQPIEFSQYILAGAQQIITETVLILVSLIGILLFNAKLFILLLIVLLPGVVIISFITKRRLSKIRESIKEDAEKTLKSLQEALNSFIESNIYGKNEFFIKRYSNYQKKLNNYIAALQTTQAIPSRMIEIFAILGLFILIIANRFLLDNNYSTNFITIGVFMASAYKIIPGIVKITNLSGQIKTYNFILHDFVNQKKTGTLNKEAPILEKLVSIIFKNITFRYNEKYILNALNLNICSSDFIGICGSSGKGKTTVINLILGFLEPKCGNILFNNLETTSSIRKLFWERIAYVKQQTFLLHDSILNNIILGESNYDKTKVLEIINICGLHELVNNHTEGYNKMITENGKNISGGQRQRIAIARALYKDADLIILDEPFNELDEESEHLMLLYLKQLAKKGKMVLMITHNKKSLSYCTKIIDIN